jgi:hypothetical protein
LGASGEAAKKMRGDEAKILKDAVDEVEEEEDEHLYHSTGWARELWIECLGMPRCFRLRKKNAM